MPVHYLAWWFPPSRSAKGCTQQGTAGASGKANDLTHFHGRGDVRVRPYEARSHPVRSAVVGEGAFNLVMNTGVL